MKEPQVQTTENTQTIEDYIAPRAMLAGAEPLLLGALVKFGGDRVAKGADAATNAALGYLRSQGPIAYVVLATWHEEAGHCAVLEFSNLTIHRLYIEEILLSEKAQSVTLELSDIIIGKRKVGLDSKKPEYEWQKPVACLPTYIKPQGSLKLAVCIKNYPKTTLSRSDVVGLLCKYTISGGNQVDADPESLTKIVRFRLRSSGPQFTTE